MGQITYKINSGYPNFTAHIEPNVAADQVHSSIGTYSFTDIPVGDYSITITDGIGCEAFVDNIHITTTTTTTTTSTSTTTTSTTLTTTTTICDTCYGIIYNGITALGTENSSLTSSDTWVIPTTADWVTLFNYIGESTAGTQLRTTGWCWWQDWGGAYGEIEGTDNYSFSVKGGGYRSNEGFFGDLKAICEFITPNSVYGTGYYDAVFFDEYTASAGYTHDSNYTGRNINMGGYVRLVNNNTLLSNGQSGTYIGNDGKSYETICIGTQEWIRFNLVETQLRDHSLIVEITDDTTWQTTLTPALCAYQNNWVYGCKP